MGQYYAPIILNDDNTIKTWIHAHRYNNGLKLMEHSYIGTQFVEAFVTLLQEPQRVVWAGDYSDPEPDEQTLYDKCNDDTKSEPQGKCKYKYLVNLTKEQYVIMNKVPVSSTYEDYEFRIHPLPLLTCEGNGRGGGDFTGRDSNNLVGYWARDLITISNKCPKGLAELIFDLV